MPPPLALLPLMLVGGPMSSALGLAFYFLFLVIVLLMLKVIGEILQGSVSGGIPAAIQRATGMSLETISDEWRDAIQTTYLPQIANLYRARNGAQVLVSNIMGRVFMHPDLDDPQPGIQHDDIGHRVDLSEDRAPFGGYQAIRRDLRHGVYLGASESRKDGHAAGY